MVSYAVTIGGDSTDSGRVSTRSFASILAAQAGVAADDVKLTEDGNELMASITVGSEALGRQVVARLAALANATVASAIFGTPILNAEDPALQATMVLAPWPPPTPPPPPEMPPTPALPPACDAHIPNIVSIIGLASSVGPSDPTPTANDPSAALSASVLLSLAAFLTACVLGGLSAARAYLAEKPLVFQRRRTKYKAPTVARPPTPAACSALQVSGTGSLVRARSLARAQVSPQTTPSTTPPACARETHQPGFIGVLPSSLIGQQPVPDGGGFDVLAEMHRQSSNARMRRPPAPQSRITHGDAVLTRRPSGEYVANSELRETRSSREVTTVDFAADSEGSAQPGLSVGRQASQDYPVSTPESSTAPRSSTTASKLIAERFDGLSGARLAASIHIVLGHLYKSSALGGEVSGVYFFRWGFTWVPWFFMLSGFVLTCARMARSRAAPRKQSIAEFIKNRTGAIYPLYVAGLLISLLIRVWQERALPDWYELLSQGVLMQSWLPWLPERTVMVHCWFLSAMLPYWVLFDILFRKFVWGIRRIRTACLWLLLLALPPWLAFVFPGSLPGGDELWYTSHRTGVLKDAVDYAVVVLKFHPLCYLHVFLFGMVLAKLRFLLMHELNSEPPEDLSAVSNATIRALEVVFRFGATLGYTTLIIIFTVDSFYIQSAALSARLSILMPWQGLVLVGLAPITAHGRRRRRLIMSSLSDPLERLLQYSSSSWGNLSYAQYVFQFIAYNLWPRARVEHAWELLLFMVWLLSCAYLASTVLVVPLSAVWKKRSPRTLLMVALCVSATLSVICALDAASRDIRRSSQDPTVDGCGNVVYAAKLPPAYVLVDAEAVDVKLNWTSTFESERTLTNPSLLWSGGVLRRAARAHAVSCNTTHDAEYAGWSNVTEYVTTWHSDVVYDGSDVIDAHAYDRSNVADDAWASWDVASWDLDGHQAPLRKLTLYQGERSEPWGPLCEARPIWQPSNSTLWRTIVTGPEDPKLALFPSSAEHVKPHASSAGRRLSVGDGALASARQLEGTQTAEDAVRIVFDSMPTAEADAVGCAATPRYQMFHTVSDISQAADGSYSARGVQLKCGSMSSPEKNCTPSHTPRTHRVRKLPCFAGGLV